MKKFVIIILSAAVLSACSSRFASNGESLYMKARNGSNLVVPKPLTSSNISHFYDLPDQNGNATVNIEPSAE